jgi:hypothetical protein
VNEHLILRLARSDRGALVSPPAGGERVVETILLHHLLALKNYQSDLDSDASEAASTRSDASAKS